MEKSPRIRIDREPSRTQLIGIPVASVMLLSLFPTLPMISNGPIVPPFAFMALIAWRLIQRTMWPIWIGIPLGFFDDMFSGQPIGSAIFLWTAALLMLDLLDRRMMWRDMWQDWGLASALSCLLLLMQLVVANSTGGHSSSTILLAQMLLTVLLYPIVARSCAFLDRVRRSA